MVTIQSLITTGDRVVAVTPLWPNPVEMLKVYGASVETVTLDFGPAGWQLEPDRLLAALTPGGQGAADQLAERPRQLGTVGREQRIILDHCRRYGIWIIADDAYERYFDGSSAPSFLDISDSDDRLVSTNSFSKTWLMTGLRIGWLTAPRQLIPEVSKLIEFSTTCALGFVQAAAQHAVTYGEPIIAETVARLRTSGDRLARLLAALPHLQLLAPARGAMYGFFKLDGASTAWPSAVT